MISLEKCREILGDEARGLSDAEFELLRQQASGLAKFILSIYLDRRAEGVTFPSEPPTATPPPPSSPARSPLPSSEREEARRSAPQLWPGRGRVAARGRAVGTGGPGQRLQRLWNTSAMGKASALNVEELSRDEKLELLDRLWESLGQDPEALPLTSAQREELDRRLDELEAEGPTGLSWDEVVAQARARSR